MFDALYLDRKGDILMAQGKKADALKAWEESYLKASEKDGIRQMLQLKLELAGGKVPAAAITKVTS
jgi:predicted negative regulator of RcsB-dependent stress response